jgi:hypothetical protein
MALVFADCTRNTTKLSLPMDNRGSNSLVTSTRFCLTSKPSIAINIKTMASKTRVTVMLVVIPQKMAITGAIAIPNISKK